MAMIVEFIHVGFDTTHRSRERHEVEPKLHLPKLHGGPCTRGCSGTHGKVLGTACAVPNCKEVSDTICERHLGEAAYLLAERRAGIVTPHPSGGYGVRGSVSGQTEILSAAQKELNQMTTDEVVGTLRSHGSEDVDWLSFDWTGQSPAMLTRLASEPGVPPRGAQ